MNTVMLISFFIIEIVFAGLAIAKNANKGKWQAGRAIASVGEVLLFLVMVIFTSVDFGLRFKMLFIMLLLRAFVAGLGWLIFHKNEKIKKILTVVGSCIISMILIAISMVPSYIFADYKGLPTTGSYSVETAKAILVDENRVETFESDGSFREIPIYFFYPKQAVEEKLPIVFFSHGAFGYYKSNFSTYAELASHGYVVVSMEHPYHALFTKDTAGKLITVDGKMFNDTMRIQNTSDGSISEEEVYSITKEWINLRLADANYVIDSLEIAIEENTLSDAWSVDSNDEKQILQLLPMMDREHIGFMGHSLGGSAAISIGRMRKDIDAVIDLDGTMVGEILYVENGVDVVNSEPYPIPLFSMDNQEHHDERIRVQKEGGVYTNNVVHENALIGYNVYIKDSGHMNFSDLPMFSPVLAKMLGTGEVDAQECMQTVNQLVLGFFDAYLKNQGDFSVQEGY